VQLCRSERLLVVVHVRGLSARRVGFVVGNVGADSKDFNFRAVRGGS